MYPLPLQNGVALLAALILVALVGVIGATVLMTISTELTISGNYQRGIQSFYLAEAGIEEGRTRLRGSNLTTTGFIADPLEGYNPRWSAYILTSSTWKSTEDQAFSKRYTNYVPFRGSQINTSVVMNSLQTKFPYWVKVRHQTEYDAERGGHRTTTPQYLDGDGSLKRHTRANPGEIIYYGYPAGGSGIPIKFTTDTRTEAFPVEILTAQADLKGGSSLIEVEVVHPSGPLALSAVYAKNGVRFLSGPSVINGMDQCRAASAKPPVYTKNPSMTQGLVTFQGRPPDPRQGPLDINLLQAIQALRPGATPLSSARNQGQLGNPANPKTFYAQSFSGVKSGSLTVGNTIGYGILLVEGSVTLEGPLVWHGIILSTGIIWLDGTNGTIRIQGGLWGDSILHLTGLLDIAYDSCAIKNALLAHPLIVKQWRQEF